VRAEMVDACVQADALGQVTSYAYDEIGEEISQTDALNRVTMFQYDQVSRRIKRTLPLGMSESYTYDSVGNTLTRNDFNGKTTGYTYGQMNRLLSKTPDPSFASIGSQFAAAVTFTYTATGQRASMTDPSGTTTYSYDSRDRLLTKATPEGTLSYSYDSAGNVLSVQSSNANGVNTAYQYDSDNRLASVTDNAPVAGNRPGSGLTGYQYDPAGNLAGYLYPNGVQTSYTYNSLNRLTNMSAVKGGPSLATYVYILGPAGNRLSVSELSGRTVNYGYDNLYRLTSEAITSDPTTANNGSINYSYDAVGNRLSRNSTIAVAPPQTLTYDSNDRLTTDTYDNDGSTVKSGANTYAYDFESRIVSVNAGAPNAISVLYDGLGNRVSKTVSGATTRYLVDDNNLTGYAQVVEELTGPASGASSSFAVSHTYIYGHMLVSESQITGSGSGPSWISSFYGLDGHGSVRFLMDASGNVTDTYDYDAFGILIHQTGSTPNVYLYSGEQFDPDLGLYYRRARYLNAFTGRFWTMDAVDGTNIDPVSLHRFLYAEDRPVDLSDPSGKFALWQLGVIGTRVHQAIGADFLSKEVVPETRFANYTNMADILKISALSTKPFPGLGYLQPDLVDTHTTNGAATGAGEVYEIKGIASAGQGAATLALELLIMNMSDPLKRTWGPGSSYTPPPLVPVPQFATLCIVDPPLGGVILYEVISLPTIMLAIAAYQSSQLQGDVAAATLPALAGVP
jgi:RHS repeat-associated protein